MSRSSVDRILTWITRFSAAVSATVLVLVLAFLATESIPALRRIGLERFFTDGSWHPLADQFNLVPMLAASVLATAGAMALAVPLGVGSAVFGRFFAPPWVARWLRRGIELMAGIPSVVFGLWGLVVLVPMLARLGGSGQSLLAASMILGLMILPTVALTAGVALRAVPMDQIYGAAALGMGNWAIARRVALPAAWDGIAAGLLLAAARAIGETMAVLMVAGNVVTMPQSLTDPVRTITANIALEMGYATRDHRSALFVSGLILMGAVLGAVLMSGCCYRKRP